MKLKLAFASLLVLSACGTSQEALQALDLMQFRENASTAGFSYAKLSGSGNDVKLEGVSYLSSPFMAMMMGMDAPEGEEAAAEPAADSVSPVLTAESVTLNGLTMKDGKPVFRDMVFNNVMPVGDMGGTKITIGSLGVEGLDEKTGAFLASVFTEEGPGEMPAFADWTVGKAGVSNVSVKGEMEGEQGLTTFDVKVGELSVSNLEDTIMGLIRISGIAGEVNMPTEMIPIAATFDLGTLDISKLQTEVFTRPFTMAMEAAMDPSATPDYASLYEGYTSPLETGYDKFDWSGMKIGVSGLKLDMTPLSQTLTRNDEGVVIASATPLTKLKLQADAADGMVGAMGLMALAMGGYPSDTIELYAGGNASFDPEKDVTRISGYNLGVTDVADVKLDIGVIGLKAALPGLMASLQSASDMMADMVETPEFDDEGNEIEPELDEDGDPIEPDEPDMSGATTAMAMQMMFALMPLQLSDLDLSITDETLLALILNQQAIGSGQSLEEFRGELVAMVQGASAFMTEAGIDSALADELTTATAGFLAGPGTLRLQLKPKQPLGILTAMTMPMTKENLGFSATFTPAAPELEAPEPAAEPVN